MSDRRNESNNPKGYGKGVIGKPKIQPVVKLEFFVGGDKLRMRLEELMDVRDEWVVNASLKACQRAWRMSLVNVLEDIWILFVIWIKTNAEVQKNALTIQDDGRCEEQWIWVVGRTD